MQWSPEQLDCSVPLPPPHVLLQDVVIYNINQRHCEILPLSRRFPTPHVTNIPIWQSSTSTKSFSSTALYLTACFVASWQLLSQLSPPDTSQFKQKRRKITFNLSDDWPCPDVFSHKNLWRLIISISQIMTGVLTYTLSHDVTAPQLESKARTQKAEAEG